MKKANFGNFLENYFDPPPSPTPINYVHCGGIFLENDF